MFFMTIPEASHLTDIKKEYVMSKQILKLGTSIGANINESTK